MFHLVPLQMGILENVSSEGLNIGRRLRFVLLFKTLQALLSRAQRLVKGEVNGGESLVDVEPCFDRV
ncbi:hypothetical protein SUGI_0475980 [Cryptomeria japonica]|nr:hypothetical protein SUGI_0475980 [Cryptomeria japonica]